MIHYKPGHSNQKADALTRALCGPAMAEGEFEQTVVAKVSASPQSPTKGRDRSLELRQCEDPTLAPYFTYLEGGVLPDDETAARELALTKRLWMMFCIAWKKDKHSESFPYC